jgi:hypothetical protein
VENIAYDELRRNSVDRLRNIRTTDSRSSRMELTAWKIFNAVVQSSECNLPFSWGSYSYAMIGFVKNCYSAWILLIRIWLGACVDKTAELYRM